MCIGSESHLAKPPFKLGEKLRSDLVARVAFNSPKAALGGIMLKEFLACFLKLVKTLCPRFDRIVFSLGERLPGHIVLKWYFGGVEGRVVYSARRLVDPARRDAGEDHRRGCKEVDDKVHWHKSI